ncbi:MAG TPA: murein biosynthesis integral membrane protein MurJ [Longilinea sp.]|nr:murein biosynthesis integral membrane protein MurJ [Longilinea sp.]
MKKIQLSHLTRITLLLAVFFGIDKIVAFARIIIVARQFGLSSELDAFNVANNLPDLLFALISGGALAMAFIPVLTEMLTKQSRAQAWDLFSRIANLAFLVTAVFSILIAIFAEPLVGWRLGIAPGFGQQQQQLVAALMRLNLFATLIFSISGLVIAGLQANQHFFLPALAPILYNFGQIFGAVVLAPEKGLSLGPITLPAFGLGVHGLVYGVILGALLHLAIQIPGLVKFGFRWTPKIGLNTEPVRKVLLLLGPRLLTMFFIQLIFIVRDNLASRLPAGSPSALTYGWMIMQVPETLIGTAIATAMLPSLAQMIANQDWETFRATIERAVQVLLALTLPMAAVLSAGLGPLLALAFGFDVAGTNLLLWVSRGYLLGLFGQSLKEVAVRTFYARQDAITPLWTAGVNLAVYSLLASQLYRSIGAAGISLADACAFTAEGLLLLWLFSQRLKTQLTLVPALLRALAAAVLGGGVAFLLVNLDLAGPQVLRGLIAMAAGVLVAVPIVWKELRLLVRL